MKEFPKQKEINLLKEKKAALEKELAEVKKELNLLEREKEEWERLMSKCNVRVRKIYFEFPFHPYGGCDRNREKVVGEEIVYMTPDEWVKAEKEVVGWGHGYYLKLAE